MFVLIPDHNIHVFEGRKWQELLNKQAENGVLGAVLETAITVFLDQTRPSAGHTGSFNPLNFFPKI